MSKKPFLFFPFSLDYIVVCYLVDLVAALAVTFLVTSCLPMEVWNPYVAKIYG